MAGKWIQKAIKRPGAFTREAERRGITPAALQRRVLSTPGRYSDRLVAQARLRRTLVST